MAVRISCCLSSSRLRTRTSSTPAASSRRTMVEPKEPVPPVTRTGPVGTPVVATGGLLSMGVGSEGRDGELAVHDQTGLTQRPCHRTAGQPWIELAGLEGRVVRDRGVRDQWVHRSLVGLAVGEELLVHLLTGAHARVDDVDGLAGQRDQLVG